MLEILEPLCYGGGMVDVVTEQETTYGSLSFRMEAGTPNIGGILAFGESIRYLREAGYERLAAREDALMNYVERCSVPLKFFLHFF